jgi:hypothetical protein
MPQDGQALRNFSRNALGLVLHPVSPVVWRKVPVMEATQEHLTGNPNLSVFDSLRIVFTPAWRGSHYYSSYFSTDGTSFAQ